MKTLIRLSAKNNLKLIIQLVKYINILIVSEINQLGSHYYVVIPPKSKLFKKILD